MLANAKNSYSIRVDKDTNYSGVHALTEACLNRRDPGIRGMDVTLICILKEE